MGSENDNFNLEKELEQELLESFDLDQLEEKLQAELEGELDDMEFLLEEQRYIEDEDNLGNVIMDVVWEQFINQVAVTAGEDFIKENNGLTLDLRNDAHIQTTENFEKGKIARHNTEIDYQDRYDDWQSNFMKDESGNNVTHKTRSGKDELTLEKGARKPFDKNRPSGSVEKKTDMDHTVSAGEIIRDPQANAHMTKDEQVEFANSSKNLNEIDSSLNRSKGDKSTTEWLDNPNSNGQKPDEIFNISKDEESKLRQKDREAREEYESRKERAEQKSIDLGKKSQKEEAFRIGGKALRTAVMQLLAELLKEIIGKLIIWFKSTKRAIGTFIDSIKEAINSFVRKLETYLKNGLKSAASTIVTSIIGPVMRTIKKAFMLIKQGHNSLKEAINHLKSPENREKSTSILFMEVGKIIIAGITVGGSLVLGDIIEKGLMAIPIFAVEIPLLGSLANILGILLGAIVSGIIGAVVINQIQKKIKKTMERENLDSRIDKGNKILKLQDEIQLVNEVKLENTKLLTSKNIFNRHSAALNTMEDSIETIRKNCKKDDSIDDEFDDIDKLFDELGDL